MIWEHELLPGESFAGTIAVSTPFSYWEGYKMLPPESVYYRNHNVISPPTRGTVAEVSGTDESAVHGFLDLTKAFDTGSRHPLGRFSSLWMYH